MYRVLPYSYTATTAINFPGRLLYNTCIGGERIAMLYGKYEMHRGYFGASTSGKVSENRSTCRRTARCTTDGVQQNPKENVVGRGVETLDLSN